MTGNLKDIGKMFDLYTHKLILLTTFELYII